MMFDLSWTSILLLSCSLLLAVYAMGLFNFGKNHFVVEGRTVLVTGASDGMGRSVVRMLAEKGANVIVVARDIAKLEATVEELKTAATSPSQRFFHISADVTEPSSAQEILRKAKEWNGSSPDIVWCVAGGSLPLLFIDATPTQLRDQMDLNYWSQAEMAHTVLQDWLSPASLSIPSTSINTKNPRPPPPRHLIFTSTSLAFYSIAGYGPYSPPKTALRSLSDTLAQEVLLYTPSAVKIHTVFPGSIRTPGLAKEDRTKPAITKILEADDPIQSPDDVARKAIRGLEHGEYLVVVNFLAQGMRACSWGGSRRNNWVRDTFMSWVTSMAWFFVAPILDSKVVKYGKEHGHPSTYEKTTA